MGRAELKQEMAAAIICKEMGWTYTEYQKQPAWFADVVVEMIKAREEELARRAKQ